ncbi:unnamed protein product [Spirodela intermedia]|uniref:GDP-D-glucose phosphorylase 1 n=1 Tax=Spirodela intermedia TaxID=51605 RepID=A0A7I8KSB0_SPIIN|nr:unnamed protein product [Spirodela intermedia]
MLTIKRVPTVVSNFQEAEESLGCGRSCLGKCCLPVAKLPLYTFKAEIQEASANGKSHPASPDEDSSVVFLNNFVLGQWEDRMSRGLFRYDVTACETKVIPGKQGFIAQLNEGRHLKKRPTEFRVDRVLQAFDPSKFNFTKVGQEEVLFRFEPSPEGGAASYTEAAPVGADASPNVVAINVSPIEYGHVLLIPRVLDRFPQRIDRESFLLALHMAAEAGSPYFRVGYNSLGAFATINHLHFQVSSPSSDLPGLLVASRERTDLIRPPSNQAYFLAVPFPVEKAPTRRIPLSSKSGVKVSSLMNYPVRGLVFEGGSNLQELSDLVAGACICLQESNTPFNVLISDMGRRIFLFPQCYAEKQALGEVDREILETQVNPAVWEISGHIVLKRKEDYEEASEAYAWRLLAEVSLSEERFEEVKASLFEATGLAPAGEEKAEEVPGDSLLQTSVPPPAASLFQDGCLVLQ